MEVTGRLYIDGSWTEGAGKRFEQRNPARLPEVTGTWPEATEAEVHKALAAAESAFREWSRAPAVKRGDLFRKVLAGIDARRDELAAALTAENGKTLKDSHAEIQSGYREMEFQVGEGLRLNGRTTPSIREGIFSYDVRVPLGVVSVVSPWNFPFNVPCRKITPALMAGNTVVLKPASLTPRTGELFVDLFHEAGFPPGVISFLTGSGRSVGSKLVTASEVRAVSFTGSTEVGVGIHKRASGQMIRTQLEMGGKNALVVLADADLEAAAEAAVTAAYTCAGQWCTATSRLIVEAPVYDQLLRRVVEKAKELKIGDGTDPEATMGPVCGSDQVESIARYLEIGKSSGATVSLGGNVAKDGKLAEGCFIEPTIFSDVTRDMVIAREEIFGPVLSVIKAESLEEAIEITNESEYGLTSSVYTRDIERAMRFVTEVETGFTHINLMTSYREPQLPFGGVKMSGFGLPEAGSSGIEFFTEHKVVYIKQ
ncbi:MAG: aldehyde dehydrogenase [Spirochaetaceae bacterium]|nr:MAG: aldehyde dehydrogenase [Spirochaetaceae bacterium]